MIQATELRIGNVIRYNNNYEVVSGINPPVPQSAAYLDCKWLVEIGGVAPFWVPIDDIEPVKLTADILVKCGFEERKLDRSKYCFMQLSHNEAFLQNNTGVWFGIMGVANYHWVNKPFGLLHQLQNLYFALTGTELQITL